MTDSKPPKARGAASGAGGASGGASAAGGGSRQSSGGAPAPAAAAAAGRAAAAAGGSAAGGSSLPPPLAAPAGSNVGHRLADLGRSILSRFSFVPQTSQFVDKGTMTPQEFIDAGDLLVFKFPTWQWSGFTLTI